MQTSSPRSRPARLLGCAAAAIVFAACSPSGASLMGPRDARTHRAAASPTAAPPQAANVADGNGARSGIPASAGQPGQRPGEALPYYIVAY